MTLDVTTLRWPTLGWADRSCATLILGGRACWPRRRLKKGRFTDSMMDELDRLEAEKRELESLLSKPVSKPPVELLSMPDLAGLFRRKVAALERLLDEEGTRAEAMDTIRALIDRADLRPLDDGTMAAELHGELAQILAQSEEARLDGSKRASGVDVSQLSVVAGARTPQNLTLCCSI